MEALENWPFSHFFQLKCYPSFSETKEMLYIVVKNNNGTLVERAVENGVDGRRTDVNQGYSHC